MALAGTGRRLKRWLYLAHRWIGIATCLLFVLWFVSGLVMLYVAFPSLDESESLAGLPPIAWEKVAAAPPAQVVGSARLAVLEMRGDRAVWRVSPWDGDTRTFRGSTGAPEQAATRAEAARIAARLGKIAVTNIEAIHSDQWTVTSRFDAHRPLWKARLAGDAGLVLYVSSTDGSVVLDTNARERFWNWLGSVPHWLYPRALRANQPLWRQVVLWSSGPCILVALTGAWIGLMRLRAGKGRRYKGRRMTPYAGWMKWHHVSGLIGSAFLILWIFSGWLSVDPGRLFASKGLSLNAERSYAGEGGLTIPDLSHLAQNARGGRRIVISRAAGRVFVRVQGRPGEERLYDAENLAPLKPDLAAIESFSKRLMPDGNPVSITKLNRADAYWYSVKGPLRLPVLRLTYDDPAATWVHIAPDTGEVVGQSDARRRVYRWLFDLFHRWDFGLLLEFPLAREVLIWVMSLTGILCSAAGVMIGWRRLRRPRAR